MGPIGLWFVAVLTALIGFIYFKVKTTYNYFKKRNVPYVEPTFLLGSNVRGALLLQHNSESWAEMYNRLKGHKIGGFFQLLKPYYIVRDPDYLSQVLISDFSHFQSRGIKTDEITNPLDSNLFFLAGKKWKFLRTKFAPLFTAGKLKWMYDEMYKCGENLLTHAEELATGKDIDFKEHLARYTTDVIGSCVFGIDSATLNNPISTFRDITREFLEPTFTGGGKFLLRFTIPDLMIKLKIKTVTDEIRDFFISLVQRAFDHRMKTDYKRNDFIQLMLELREKGKVHIDAEDVDEMDNQYFSQNDSSTVFELNDSVFAAQSFVFLLAGFETSASTLHFLFYFFSKHPDIQEKAREEVWRVKNKFGHINYEAVKEMDYIEKCILETLRLFPPIPNLFRECTKTLTFPNGVTIEKGVSLAVPIFALHRDPQYFPDPLVFKPERFDQPPRRGTYAPFGDGPRICIGKRFALVELKMTSAKILEKFSLEQSTKVNEPIQLAPMGFSYFIKKGLHMKIKKLPVF